MTFPDVEHWLQNTIGLDPTTIGSSAIERGVRERMKACGFDNLGAYWESVCDSPLEMQALIEAVVIPETWFFRDVQAFVALAKIVQQEWLPKHPTDALRLLSVPCSTGEEPYSLAISLHASGLDLSRFQIDAMDISERALTGARKGLFRRNSFRGSDLEFRNNYFEQTSDGHLLTESIRNQVHFEKGNLLDENFGIGREKYDFIFCRNLLIYFDTATQARAMITLKRMLSDSGYLFVGPSESCVMSHHGLVSSKLPLAFAFQKATEPSTETTFRKGKEKTAARTMFAARPEAVKTRPLVTSFLRKTSAQIKVEPPKPDIDLVVAHRLADEGKLEQAAEICHAYIRRGGVSADAFYLLGLVQDASNCRQRAHDFYRRALYLQPDHYEALVHLALLTKANGDVEAARVLQERARRVKGVQQ